MTDKIKSPLLTAYTATQNIVPQEEHEIKVSLQICVVYTLGYITLGQAPPSLMLILAAREIQDITPLKIRSRKFDMVPWNLSWNLLLKLLICSGSFTAVDIG